MIPPKLKQVFAWCFVLAIGAFVALYLHGLINVIGPEQWFHDTLKSHFAAVVGLPLAALGAMAIIIIFGVHSGSIEFEGFGLKFRGASGPIIFWVICFLAITGAIRLLWSAGG